MQGLRRRPRNQGDSHHDQGRNIAEQMPVLGGVLQGLHRHDAGVNQARPRRGSNEAAIRAT